MKGNTQVNKRTMNMTLDDVMAAMKCNTYRELTEKWEEIGWPASYPAFVHWRKSGVPLGRQCFLHIYTRGRLQSPVSPGRPLPDEYRVNTKKK